MRILVFTSQIHLLGGAERLAVELAEELCNRPGVHVDLLSMVPDNIPGTAETKRRLLCSGVNSVRFLGRPPASGLVHTIRAMVKLRRILIEGNYDIIETSMHGPTSLASWATGGLRTGHVAGIHDVFRRDHQNSLRHRVWRYSCRTKQSTRFYAISRYVADSWIKYSGCEPERTRVVYNSIHRRFFDARPERKEIRDELGASEESKLILFVGRLCKRKGIDIAWQGLRPLLRSDDLQMVFVGIPNQSPERFFAGDNGLMDRINESIARESLGNRVHFLGQRKDVPRLMASADVLIHPVRKEGFGLVLAEALATGLPIVATDVDGIPEVLEGSGSLLIPPEDPDALHDAVLKVLRRGSEETAESNRKAIKRANFFRPERRAEQMLALFQDVLNQTSGGAGPMAGPT